MKFFSSAILKFVIFSLETWKTEEKQKVSSQLRKLPLFPQNCSRARQPFQYRRSPARLTVLDVHHESERKGGKGIRAAGRVGSKCGDKRWWKCQTVAREKNGR